MIPDDPESFLVDRSFVYRLLKDPLWTVPILASKNGEIFQVFCYRRPAAPGMFSLLGKNLMNSLRPESININIHHHFILSEIICMDL